MMGYEEVESIQYNATPSSYRLRFGYGVRAGTIYPRRRMLDSHKSLVIISYRRKTRQPYGPPGQRAPSKQNLALAASVLCSYDTDRKHMTHFSRYALDKWSNFCRHLLHYR